METVLIYITKADLHEYFKTLSNRGVIRKARMRIFNAMPKGIKEEYKTTVNDLVCIDEKEGVYKTIAKNGSEALQTYLNYFIFKLKKDEDSI